MSEDTVATQELCIVIRTKNQAHMVILQNEHNDHYSLIPAKFSDVAKLHGADR